MDDLISRQASIDVVGGWFKKIGLNGDICLDAIVSLPSAEPEPESISKWKKEFREYVDSLDIARDDWKGDGYEG